MSITDESIKSIKQLLVQSLIIYIAERLLDWIGLDWIGGRRKEGVIFPLLLSLSLFSCPRQHPSTSSPRQHLSTSAPRQRDQFCDTCSILSPTFHTHTHSSSSSSKRLKCPSTPFFLSFLLAFFLSFTTVCFARDMPLSFLLGSSPNTQPSSRKHPFEFVSFGRCCYMVPANDLGLLTSNSSQLSLCGLTQLYNLVKV